MEHTDHDERPLEIVQVGIVVRDLEKTIQRLKSIWSLGPFRFLELDVPDAILHGKQTPLKAKLAWVQVGPVQLEFMEPGEGRVLTGNFFAPKGRAYTILRSLSQISRARWSDSTKKA